MVGSGLVCSVRSGRLSVGSTCLFAGVLVGRLLGMLVVLLAFLVVFLLVIVL